MTCYFSYLRSTCVRIPALTKFFFNVAARCANYTLSCQVGQVLDRR